MARLLCVVETTDHADDPFDGRRRDGFRIQVPIRYRESSSLV